MPMAQGFLVGLSPTDQWLRLLSTIDNLAEDTSDASIACRQIGPVRFLAEIEDGEEVFSERRSILFKRLHVVRFLDKKRNTLVYLVYSDKLIEGSPKNAISTVPIMPWLQESGTRNQE
jgi:catabolite regulation protein CreA